MRLERANSKKPLTWLSFAGLVLIPIIVAAGFILATYKSSDRLDTIEAAIVNNDEGAEVDGQTVPVGRQLTSGLVGEDANNIRWVITDDEDAEKGLSDGTYAAVLTIPEGFSRSVTSVSDARMASQTELDIDVSGIVPAADTVISQSVAEVARTTFNTEMTKTYLDNIYLGFNDMGTQMRDLGEAAGELDKGARDLSAGTKEAAGGAGELSKGMGELDTAGGELNRGAGDLASGAGDLETGASELSGGLQEMKKSTADLPDDTQKLADGAGELSDGVDEYTTSIDEIIKAFSGGTGTGSGGGDLSTLVDGAEGLSTGLQQYRDGLAQNADDAQTLAESGTVEGLDDLVEAGLLTNEQSRQIRDQLCSGGSSGEPVPDDVCQGRERAYALGLLNGTSGALDGAVQGLEQENEEGVSLLGGAEQLASGIEDGLGDLAEGMKDLSANAPKLLDASKGLREGASGVAEGNQQLADGMPQLSEGIAKVADGSHELSDGAGQLSTGLDTFAGGLDRYVSGVSTAATGTGDLATGMDTLAEGAQKYAEGSGKFAEGVGKGADEIPSYTAPERDNLGEVVASSVKAPSTDSMTDVLQGSTIALLIMLALWVGGLVTYTVLKPIPSSTLLSTKSSVAVWLRGLWPGIAIGLIQALVLAIMAVSVMEIDAVQAFDIVVLTFVAALVFMVLNFALVAWFGGVGRFLSVIAVVLAVAGRTIGAVPEFFHALAPILPLTPAMNGFAAITAGANGLGAAYGGLLAWALIGGVMSLLAIVRARTTRPALALAMA